MKVKMNKQLDDIKQKVLPVLSAYHIKKAGLFGSRVNGELKTDSDVDILVEIEEDASLFDFIDIKLKLEEVLEKKVDLVEYSAIKPLLKEKILNDEVRIL